MYQSKTFMAVRKRNDQKMQIQIIPPTIPFLYNLYLTSGGEEG